LLAGLSLETKLLRLEHSLRRKDWSDQPRAPAGQSNGGQWVAEGGGRDGGRTLPDDALPLIRPQWAQLPGAQPTQTREETLLDDGTRVLSIRIHAGRRDFDEQHTVTAPDGESRIFETSGATQTIRDGVSGEVLSRSRFTEYGVEPEATLQPAFLQFVPAAVATVRIFRTLELAGTLYSALSARRGGYGTILGATAHEFQATQDDRGMPVIWVGRVDQQTLEAACPKTEELQSRLDTFNAIVRASGLYRTPAEIGNVVHFMMDQWVKAQNDKDLRSELSIRKDGLAGSYGEAGTSRIDIYHRPRPTVACIYDHKTGVRGLAWSNALRYAVAARKYFPETQRIIVIQLRPHT
jgi:hypothetical protein